MRSPIVKRTKKEEMNKKKRKGKEGRKEGDSCCLYGFVVVDRERCLIGATERIFNTPSIRLLFAANWIPCVPEEWLPRTQSAKFCVHSIFGSFPSSTLFQPSLMKFQSPSSRRVRPILATYVLVASRSAGWQLGKCCRRAYHEAAEHSSVNPKQ
jgi:hypothetical protein